MDKHIRRRALRTKRDNDSRRAKFIEGYIKAKHPVVYAEACHTYKQVGNNNKGKKDLRKTNEYIKLTTPYKDIRQYYDRPNRTGARQYTDGMVLNIQLMGVGSCQKKHTPPYVPESNDPPPYVPESNDPPPCVPESNDPPPYVPLPPIPDATFYQLLEDIRKDPELDRIFKDLTDVDNTSDDIGKDPELDRIFDDLGFGEDNTFDDIVDLSGIDIELQTPLEIELHKIC